MGSRTSKDNKRGSSWEKIGKKLAGNLNRGTKKKYGFKS